MKITKILLPPLPINLSCFIIHKLQILNFLNLQIRCKFKTSWKDKAFLLTILYCLWFNKVNRSKFWVGLLYIYNLVSLYLHNVMCHWEISQTSLSCVFIQAPSKLFYYSVQHCLTNILRIPYNLILLFFPPTPPIVVKKKYMILFLKRFKMIFPHGSTQWSLTSAVLWLSSLHYYCYCKYFGFCRQVELIVLIVALSLESQM